MLYRTMPSNLGFLILLLMMGGSWFGIGLPVIALMREMPAAYYSSLPVATEADFDRDGIPNNYDATPMPELLERQKRLLAVYK